MTKQKGRQQGELEILITKQKGAAPAGGTRERVRNLIRKGRH